MSILVFFLPLKHCRLKLFTGFIKEELADFPLPEGCNSVEDLYQGFKKILLLVFRFGVFFFFIQKNTCIELSSLDDDELDRRTPALMGSYPNTYTYSKGTLIYIYFQKSLLFL